MERSLLEVINKLCLVTPSARETAMELASLFMWKKDAWISLAWYKISFVTLASLQGGLHLYLSPPDHT